MLRLLDQFHKRDSQSEYSDVFDAVDRAKRVFLFDWLVAHELGHLVLGHSSRDMARSWAYRDGVPVGLEIEKEADEFFVKKLHNNIQRQQAAYLGLSDFVTALYRQAVLEQYSTNEISKQIEKHGDDFIYETELNIKLTYRSIRHPPWLVRALNLAELIISRYPLIVDTSGYFERIRERIVFETGMAVPNTPIPSDPLAAEDKPTPSKPVFVKHALILALGSAPQLWVDATLSKAQDLSETDSVAWRRAGSLVGELIRWSALSRASEARERIESTIEASAQLPEQQQAAVKISAYAAMGRLGILSRAEETAAAVEDARQLINEMARAGLIDLGSAGGRVEALRMLLEIALARNNDRGGPIEAMINAIFEDILLIQDMSLIDVQLVHRVLVADFAWLWDDVSRRSAASQSELLAAANAATRIAGFAGRRKWTIIEARFIAHAISALKKMAPTPHGHLAQANYELGCLLMTLERPQESLTLFLRAINEADKHLEKVERTQDASDDENEKLTSIRLSALNNFGYVKFRLGAYAEALAPLEAAYRGRLAERSGRSHSIEDKRADIEFATVNQNLADVCLALGRFEEALERARYARQCRIQLGDIRKSTESARTEGYALLYAGQEQAGRTLLERYASTMRALLDTKSERLAGAIVSHQYVLLEQFVTVPNIDDSTHWYGAELLPEAEHLLGGPSDLESAEEISTRRSDGEPLHDKSKSSL